AKAFLDEGLLRVEVAKRMGKRKTQVTKYLQHWYTSRGITPPDGRKERANRARKHSEPPPYQQLAEPAMTLWREGMSMTEISGRLDVSRDMATKIIRFWHESRGLKPPD